MKKYTLFSVFFIIVFLCFSVNSASAGLPKDPSIDVISPNGGEVLVQGKAKTIQWSFKNYRNSSLIGLQVYLVDSVDRHKIARIDGGEDDAFLDLDTHSIKYVPDTTIPVGEYRVMVTSRNLAFTTFVFDVSDAPFSIVASS